MDEEIAQVVQQYGWYVANVADADPPFLYTIGLMENWQHPEFIIFGLDANNAYALLSELVNDLRDGKRYAENGVLAINVGGDVPRVGFRRVHSTQHPLYLGSQWDFSQGSVGSVNSKRCRRFGPTIMDGFRSMLVVILGALQSTTEAGHRVDSP